MYIYIYIHTVPQIIQQMVSHVRIGDVSLPLTVESILTVLQCRVGSTSLRR
jgi:hypothetical protein